MNENFAWRIKYVQICSEGDKKELEKIKESIKPTGEKYLSAYVEVEKYKKIQLRCFIHCTDANSIDNTVYCYGLFDESKATKIKILSCGSEIENIYSMFSGCSCVKKLDLSKFNTSNVKNMCSMFSYCSSLTELDLSNLDTENVTDMSYMFNNCSSLTILNLSNFNTNNVKDMSYMFSYCSSLTNINLSKFNTTNITDMQFMFANCRSLTALNLSNFNTDNVTDMNSMFWGCSSLNNLDLSNFNTDNVTDMSFMFNNCFQNNATLICKASTIKKITENGGLRLIIPNENEKKSEINDILNNNNTDKVYTCTVERFGNNPEITDVVEYQITAVEEYQQQ